MCWHQTQGSIRKWSDFWPANSRKSEATEPRVGPGRSVRPGGVSLGDEASVGPTAASRSSCIPCIRTTQSNAEDQTCPEYNTTRIPTTFALIVRCISDTPFGFWWPHDTAGRPAGHPKEGVWRYVFRGERDTYGWGRSYWSEDETAIPCSTVQAARHAETDLRLALLSREQDESSQLPEAPLSSKAGYPAARAGRGRSGGPLHVRSNGWDGVGVDEASSEREVLCHPASHSILAGERNCAYWFGAERTNPCRTGPAGYSRRRYRASEGVTVDDSLAHP